MAGSNGLKMEKIARHVYNACNSFFIPLDYKEVHHYVYQFLTNRSKNAKSIIIKGEKHGIYCIDFNSSEAQQMILKFAPHVDEEEPTKPCEDRSLSLF